MIHRFIHDALTIGVTAIRGDDFYLDDLFTVQFPIDTTEREAIKTYFADKGLNVINGYARRDSPFPLVSIVLAREREAETFLGDFASLVDAGPHLGADVESAIWEHTYHLYVYTGHPDITAAYYEIVKSIMLAALKLLTDDDVFEFSFSGMDMAPDPKYIPEHLFVRQLAFVCQSEFQRVDRDSLLGKAFQISGLHIDSSGSPSDVGGVKTLVDPYAVGDDDAET